MTALMTVEEAADMARCDPRVIRRAIKLGELDAMFSSRWLLVYEELETWLRDRARKRSVPLVPQRRKRAARARDDRTGSVVRLSEMRGEQT